VVPAWWGRLVFGGLAALLCLVLARAEERMPRVLILNSYHPGYGWSDGEMLGVMKALHRPYPTLLPSIEYLDTRRFPLAEREPSLIRALEEKYSGQNFDAQHGRAPSLRTHFGPSSRHSRPVLQRLQRRFFAAGICAGARHAVDSETFSQDEVWRMIHELLNPRDRPRVESG
jgi:hypothetical protein